jgi:hypothetical protein
MHKRPRVGDPGSAVRMKGLWRMEVALTLAAIAVQGCGGSGTTPCTGPSAEPQARYGTWTWDQSGWVQQSQKMVPGPLVYDDATKQVLAYDSDLHDKWGLWAFSGGSWAFVGRPPHAPAPDVTGGTDVYLAYDAGRKSLLLFQCLSESTCETLTWDGTSWQNFETTVDPGYLSGASIVYDDIRRRIVLFGGANFTQEQSQKTWLWDGVAWVLANPTTSPPSRTDGAIAFDRSHGEGVLFGGRTNFPPYGPLNDTWLWNGTTWSQIYPRMSPPAARAQMTFDAATHEIVLVSGTQTWVWHDQTWSMPSQSAGPPGGQLTYDADQREVVLTVNYPPCLFFGP